MPASTASAAGSLSSARGLVRSNDLSGVLSACGLVIFGAAFRELIGNYEIAMTAVQVSALIEDRAKVEIEVTAVVPE